MQDNTILPQENPAPTELTQEQKDIVKMARQTMSPIERLVAVVNGLKKHKQPTPLLEILSGAKDDIEKFYSIVDIETINIICNRASNAIAVHVPMNMQEQNIIITELRTILVEELLNAKKGC